MLYRVHAIKEGFTLQSLEIAEAIAWVQQAHSDHMSALPEGERWTAPTEMELHRRFISGEAIKATDGFTYQPVVVNEVRK